MKEKYLVLEDRFYTETHEWVKLDGKLAVVGITDYAQKKLHEIVYVDLPEVGIQVSKGDEIAEIESVKSVAEVYSPISGEITHVNNELIDNPGLINSDPYGNGWIVKLKPINWDSEIHELLTADRYRKLIIKEEGGEL